MSPAAVRARHREMPEPPGLDPLPDLHVTLAGRPAHPLPFGLPLPAPPHAGPVAPIPLEEEAPLTELDEPFLEEDPAGNQEGASGKTEERQKKAAGWTRPRPSSIEGALAGVGGPDPFRTLFSLLPEAGANQAAFLRTGQMLGGITLLAPLMATAEELDLLEPRPDWAGGLGADKGADALHGAAPPGRQWRARAGCAGIPHRPAASRAGIARRLFRPGGAAARPWRRRSAPSRMARHPAPRRRAAPACSSHFRFSRGAGRCQHRRPGGRPASVAGAARHAARQAAGGLGEKGADFPATAPHPIHPEPGRAAKGQAAQKDVLALSTAEPAIPPGQRGLGLGHEKQAAGDSEPTRVLVVPRFPAASRCASICILATGMDFEAVHPSHLPKGDWHL